MSKGASVFLAIIILFTFPLWIGLLIGILGAIFGIIVGIFGAIFGVLGSLFAWGWPGSFLIFPHLHLNSFVTAAIILVLALLIAKGQSGGKSGKE